MAASVSVETIRAEPSRSRATPRTHRPALRLLPAPTPSLRRGPFIALVLTLVIIGTVGLLVLNTVIAADSFRVEQLVQRNAELALAEQELQRQVAEGLSPEALAEAARELGMVPAGQPAFVIVGPDGAIVIQGTPVPAGVR
ncbi:MAG: hypothetical protein H0U15_10615 [Geodermatophilaceae bacterium]|nr:hypothetical protein [Geodermatophilaceae bacterium]